MADGKHLGPVGGRIVAEVFIGLLQGDPMSYLCQEPGWTPNLGATPDQFSMVDLLNKAGRGDGALRPWLTGSAPTAPGSRGSPASMCPA